MRRLLSGLAFGLAIFTSMAAQGNGNGYGNSGNGNGYGNNGYGQGDGSWANVDLITWLENGGEIPPRLAAKVIFEARAWGQQQFGLNYGQMLQKYSQGLLTIQYLSTAPPTLMFRVSYGNLSISVIIDG
jgi:hypothetical protein